MATWLEKSRSPEYSPAKLSQTLAEVESIIGISELDEAMAGETIIVGGYLNTHLIKAKSIIAEHLDVDSLSAISADIGNVTSGTLTGATVRTSAGGDRIELSGEGYGAALSAFLDGTKRIEINYSNLFFYDEDGGYAGGLHAAKTEPLDETILMIMTDKTIELLSDRGTVGDLDMFGRLTVTSGDTTHDPLARPSVIMSAYASSKGVDLGVHLNPPNNAQHGFFNGLGPITDTEFHFGSKVFSYDLYAVESVSAKTFVDRTPFFEGDALAEIIKIKGQNGELDHKTLPEFARASIIEPEPLDIEKDGRHIKLALSNYPDKETEGRDIGAMVSMLVVAVQQLKDIVDKQQEQLLEVMGIDKGIIDKGPDKEQLIIP